jgi:D-alanyl-D-alanine dipeptidase
MKKVLIVFLLLSVIDAQDLPSGFVSVKEVIPGIQLELRYLSRHNFMGRKVDGYHCVRAVLTQQAAQALAEAQSDLNRFGLGLKIFDAYRPQKAVDDFVRWGRDLADTVMKEQYYPFVDKENLFREGYIAEKSGHSRGSTLDLTIIDLKTGKELDMGSHFDFFGKSSWVTNPDITHQQRANRMLLNLVMKRHGFKAYDREWWHFTLEHEPYPDTYFDFDN